MNPNMLLANDYQDAAQRTMNEDLGYHNRLSLGALGIGGEGGEIIDHIKKFLYHGHKLDKEKLAEELGDLLWYVATLCETLDITMSQVMATNIVKLSKRYPDKFSHEASINRKDG